MAGGSSLAAWLTLAFWRRKSIVLLICVLLVAMIAIVRYSHFPVPRREEEDPALRPLPAQDKRILLGGLSVQFVAGPAQTATQVPKIRSQDVVHQNAIDDRQLTKQVKSRNDSQLMQESCFTRFYILCVFYYSNCVRS